MSDAADKGGPSEPVAASDAAPAAAAANTAPAKPEIPEGYKILKEGKASILQKGNEVFYNEAQVTNRDLSVAALRIFLRRRQQEIESGVLKKGRKEKGGGGGGGSDGRPRGPRLLEGLAASGLRSIRYALEVPELGRIDANDLDKDAVSAMSRNVALNGGDAAVKIRVLCSDARLTMLQNPGAYDVVDLDPYGTPANLLDSAVQSVSDGGLLMVTATDMANLCGNNSTACWANYGIYPVHRSYCHEMALRIVLACIETHAARYKRRIVPLLSLSVDFYVRLFVRVYTSPNDVKDSPSRLAYLWQSSGCDSFWLQPVGQKKQHNGSSKFMPGSGPAVEPRCPDTGSGYIMGGPIWAGPIHDGGFVSELLKEVETGGTNSYAQAVKVRGYLLSASQELPDAPLYYNLHDICKMVRITPPKSDVFRSALVHAGYRVSGSHACPLAIKTDAPPSVVWDVVRCWVRRNGVSAAAVKDPDSYSAKLLAKEPSIQANFSVVASAMARTKEDKTPRFVHNPAYWGPKARHGRPDQTRPQQGEQQGEGASNGAGGSGRGGRGGGRRDKGRGRGGRGGGEAAPAAAATEEQPAPGQGEVQGEGQQQQQEVAVAENGGGVKRPVEEEAGAGAGGGEGGSAVEGGGEGDGGEGTEREAKRQKAE
ncbi:hypothetical protein PLESTB_001115800 [Pleodorina starrii]|uniref:tRNA (guanine(26)-N(2))-dimethyltransferase n=1 Tax=Pleodorina starrii TaxID=330485 RepID=A0A9W6BQH2_9CHLO|nr:hypothetical protein PLESTM_001352600 [Pleodorina starrii]GLC56516.1 hypothetical protein PLESTB_001115800 [Pleodorina starrii]